MVAEVGLPPGSLLGSIARPVSMQMTVAARGRTKVPTLPSCVINTKILSANRWMTTSVGMSSIIRAVCVVEDMSWKARGSA